VQVLVRMLGSLNAPYTPVTYNLQP